MTNGYKSAASLAPGDVVIAGAAPRLVKSVRVLMWRGEPSQVVATFEGFDCPSLSPRARFALAPRTLPSRGD
jgi:hypothetical protein